MPEPERAMAKRLHATSKGKDRSAGEESGELSTELATFTLTPTASGTRLSLVQSGFKPDQKREFGGACYRWKMMGGKLVDLLVKI